MQLKLGANSIIFEGLKATVSQKNVGNVQLIPIVVRALYCYIRSLFLNYSIKNITSVYKNGLRYQEMHRR
jgi:hypothetical protein